MVNPIVHPTSYPTHIPFIPSESTLPFVRYSNFNNLPWKSKVKVMGEVKVESHNMGPTFDSHPFHFMSIGHPIPKMCQIWQVFGPWASPYGENDHDSAQLQAQTILQNLERRNSVKRLQRYGFCKSDCHSPTCPDCDDNTPPVRRAEG